eukprot:CAMPEP_0168443536 /NCGR_PEP_ID=MMETSP0228-20121227/44582_1 /TAXON_ID=133427 /ORGANISM="Protoceratium reticulatum, Strain CCCM 535 (=CCMP 1889)" /LENGTH=353 /DNA_ID=CAMNT_0008457947 /DNA_START=42 /DNA_END=1100 /DNA_ORIENTATION=-
MELRTAHPTGSLIAAGSVPPLRLTWHDGSLLLQSTEEREGDGFLRIMPNKKVDFKGGRGKWAHFRPVLCNEDEQPQKWRLLSVGHAEAGLELYLRLDGAAAFAATPETAGSAMFSPLRPEECSTSNDAPALAPLAPPTVPFQLSAEQKRQFMADGFLHLHNLVPSELVEEALRHINIHLSKGPAAWTEDEDGTASLAADVNRAPAVANLLYASPALAAAEELLGPSDARKRNIQGGQVALRFPQPRDGRAKPDDQWHIDGMKQWHMSPFQLLVGVALSAQPTDECGNLGLWPGSHAINHEAVVRARSSLAAEAGASDGAKAEAAEAKFDPTWGGHKPDLGSGTVQHPRVAPGD